MEQLTALLKNSRAPRPGAVGTDLGWYPVADLPLPSGKLWVGDPGFSWAELRSNDGLRVSLEPGRYRVAAFVMAFGKSNMVARLRVCRAGVRNPALGSEIGEAGTDSAVIGVGDAKAVWSAFQTRFGDDEREPVLFLERFKFRRCGLLQPDGPAGAAIVYVNSGFGDGSGPVFALREGRKRVGVGLEFIEPGATA